MSQEVAPSVLSYDPAEGQHPRYPAFRWVVCLLLFFATSINYMDRQILGILADTLKKEIGWSELQYGHIVIAFQAAYMIGQVSFGWLIDRAGTKRGYSLSILVWSLAAAGHALAHSVLGFGVARFVLGIGEAGNFPAAIKTIAEWFPKKERSLATGLFNCGSNVGAILAPALVPVMYLVLGWRWSFVALGVAGVAWLFFWVLLYQRPTESRRVTPAQLDALHADDEVTTSVQPIGWLRLLPLRQTWAYIVASSMTSPCWWFYLYWLPKFFQNRYHLDLTHLGAPLVVVYSMALVGSIAGGYLPALLLDAGWSLNKARKISLLVCALLTVPVVTVTHASNQWLATLLFGLATSAHQGMSANLYTMVPDLFPKRAVASVVGLGAACGALAAMGFAEVAGLVLQRNPGNYLPLFLVCGTAYPLSLLFVHLLVPRWQPVSMEDVVVPGFEVEPL